MKDQCQALIGISIGHIEMQLVTDPAGLMALGIACTVLSYVSESVRETARKTFPIWTVSFCFTLMKSDA